MSEQDNNAPKTPWPKGERGSLQVLFDWLCELDQQTPITAEYKLDDLTDDLRGILDEMWSDGIDAMGEDA